MLDHHAPRTAGDKTAATLRQIKSLMRKHNVPGKVGGRGSNWEVELPDEAALKLWKANIEPVIGATGGYRSGYGSWILRPGYESKGDWNDPSSRHHYARDLRDATVRLAHGKPELREHLLPLIEAADRESMYSIEPGGLRRLERGALHLQPNHAYWMGASSSPTMIIVTGVTDRDIQYVQGPDYSKTRRIQRLIGEDLIRQGTQTWVKRYGGRWPEWSGAFRKLLSGQPSSLTMKPVDFQSVHVKVRPSKPHPDNPLHHLDKGDLWRHVEQYGGTAATDDHYRIRTDRQTARKMKQDPLIDVIDVQDVRR